MQPLYIIPGKSLVLVSTCGSRFLRSLTKRSQSSLRYTHFSHNNKMAGGDEINVAALATPKPRVAVVQMNSTKDKERNYGICTGLIKKAKACGADMVFLPECFDFVGGSKERSLALAETLDGDIISRYKDIARKQKVWLSLGGFHEKGPVEDPDRIYNTHIILDNEGNMRARYCKTHLFDVDIKGKVRLKETDVTIPGEEIVPPVETPVGKVGMMILRFPEISLALSKQGAEILTYPSAFTQTTGMAHWEVLLRSRAIENQCYVIAAAQTGAHHEKRTSYGHAMIVNPWGVVVAECQEGNNMCVAEIDLEYMNKVKEGMSMNRRHDLYGHIHTYTKGDLDEADTYQFGQVQVNSNQVFYKSALSYGFVNRKPVVPGHVLVSPLRVMERYADMKPEEIADLFQAAQTISGVMEKHYGCTSVSVGIQDGPEAGQSIRHVHVHILPRKGGDFKRNDDIYEALETHDKNVKESEWRSDEDMAKEAAQLRPYFE